MNSVDLNKQRLTEICQQIDEEAFLSLKVNYRPKVIIAGGSALILRSLTNRSVTHDVDVLSYDEALSTILSKYNSINSNINAYCDCVPYNFEDRLIKLNLNTKKVDFYILSHEDLAVMKLYSWRNNDIKDLNSIQFTDSLNWDLLDTLVFSENEAKASCLVKRRYDEMVNCYKKYAKENNHELNV